MTRWTPERRRAAIVQCEAEERALYAKAKLVPCTAEHDLLWIAGNKARAAADRHRRHLASTQDTSNER